MLLQFNLLRMQHHWIYASNVEAFFWFKPIAWMIVIVDHVDVFFWNQTEIEVRRLGCKNSHLLFIIFGIFSGFFLSRARTHILHLSDMGMKNKTHIHQRHNNLHNRKKNRQRSPFTTRELYRYMNGSAINSTK